MMADLIHLNLYLGQVLLNKMTMTLFSVKEWREEAIRNANTVAIKFSFIRSQVTLLTSQPGMTPIVLPAINTQKLNG